MVVGTGAARSPGLPTQEGWLVVYHQRNGHVGGTWNRYSARSRSPKIIAVDLANGRNGRVDPAPAPAVGSYNKLVPIFRQS